MKKIKKIVFASVFALLMLFILLISSFNVEAFGIAPSRKIINYDPSPLADNSHTITARIVNSEAKDMTLQLSADGELAEYVTINDPILNIDSSEGEKYFTYDINLPEDLSPGSRSVNIVATEISANGASSNIGGYISLTHQLFVNVPYTGLHAGAEISISSSENNIITATAIVSNIGDQQISDIDARLEIFEAGNSGNGNIVYSKNIDSFDQSLSPSENVRIEDRFSLEKRGEYTAKFIIEYDNKKIEQTRDFRTGSYAIEVLGAEVDNFRLGTIAKFDIDLASEWNTQIDNVYTEMTIFDQDENIVDTIKSDRVTIDPDGASEESLVAYWDTKDVKSGVYRIELKVFAGDQIITKEYYTTVGIDKIIIDEDAPQSSGLEKEGKAGKIILIVLLIIILVGIAAYYIMRHRDQYSGYDRKGKDKKKKLYK